MKFGRDLVTAVIVSSALWGGAAFAEGVGPRFHHGDLGGPLLRAVGLTDAQKTQIRAIFANHRSNFRALGQQLRAARKDFEDKLYGPTPPSAADLATIGQLRDQLAKERLAVALEVRNVLTPDQLAKAAAIRQQLDQLRQQRRNLLNPTS